MIRSTDQDYYSNRPPDGREMFEPQGDSELGGAMTDKLTDRELDDWLAEHVMGWHWDGNSEGWYDNDNVLCLYSDWHPPEDMNQAMTLIETLRPRGLYLVLTDLGDGGWGAQLMREREKGELISWDEIGAAADQSPARAICLAVKEAVGDG